MVTMMGTKEARVVKTVLSDGSEVFDVRFETDNGTRICIGCVDLKQAEKIAFEISSACFIEELN